jgi:hypothetical protein
VERSQPTRTTRIHAKTDQVWENIVATIGEVVVEQGNTLNEQIAVDEQRAKIEKEIASLKRQMKATNQSKRKAELYDQIKKLEKNLKEQHNG